MRQAGLALGGSLDNAVVLGETGVLNNPLRFPDEFVRHKMPISWGISFSSWKAASRPRRRPARRACAPHAAGEGDPGNRGIAGLSAPSLDAVVAAEVPEPAFARTASAGPR